ncbi:Glutamine amidotransferase [Aphelenchoides besseyi]|nr:Glutamine amidotransferase [Aphelenchoides besseyi]
MDQEIAEKVVILDFGAQYGKVIDRRVRECNVFSEMLPLSTTAKEISKRKFKAIIISGGPSSVYDNHAPKYDPEIFNLGLPILGICYGFQLINKNFGGNVAAHPFRVDGQRNIKIHPECSLFNGLKSNETVLLTHGDSVLRSTVAPEFKIVAEAEDVVTAIANESKKIYGVQFHPEVDLTENGRRMFENFLRKVVGLHATYTIANREKLCIDYIRDVVGDKKILAMVSGGVDSTVCAALLHRALGKDSVVAIHIDNGFMRFNESRDVVLSLNNLGLNVQCFHYIDEFLNSRLCNGEKESPPLKCVTNPEEKRMIIGDTFMRCKDYIMQKLNLGTDMFIAQGTLRPDLIESASSLASGCADTIKTHHNDTALVRELRNLGKVVEPLKDFHKDEVRELGRQLGLPELIVNRHPFPGPGLAIRIICADRPFLTDTFADITKEIKSAIEMFLKSKKVDIEICANLLPIRTVGVQGTVDSFCFNDHSVITGDRRTYSYPVALSTDQRPVPWDLLDDLAKLLPTVDHHINRVVYAFGSAVRHPIRDITVTRLNEGPIEKLRTADHIVTQVLNGVDADGNMVPGLEPSMRLIQQMPVVLIPVQFNEIRRENLVSGTFVHSIVLRPFITNDFMTGKNALPTRDIPEEVIKRIVQRISTEVPFISRVLIDLTAKPPATTEWE